MKKKDKKKHKRRKEDLWNIWLELKS